MKCISRRQKVGHELKLIFGTTQKYDSFFFFHDKVILLGQVIDITCVLGYKNKLESLNKITTFSN